MNTLTPEMFFRLDLPNLYYGNGRIFDKELLLEIKNKYIVYLIINNNNTYYVGLSVNIKNRIRGHMCVNTNDIRNGSVYILEILDTEKHMRYMEMLWIAWFRLHSICVNMSIADYKLKSGEINNKTINNTRYQYFINNKIIPALNLLDKTLFIIDYRHDYKKN